MGLRLGLRSWQLHRVGGSPANHKGIALDSAYGMEEEEEEDYICALTKPHGSCRGPSGGDMHIQTSNQKIETTALKYKHEAGAGAT